MIKKSFIGFGVLLVILLCYGGYRIATFNLFDTEFIELKSITIPNKQYTLKLFLIPSNATSKKYVQVRKVESKVEEVLANYERYNHVENYYFQDSSVYFILKNTSLNTSALDTIPLRLP